MEFVRKIWRWAGSSHSKFQAVRPGDGAPMSLGKNRGASFVEDYEKLEGKFTVRGDFADFWIATRIDGKKSAIRVWNREEVDASDLKRLRNEARLLHTLEHDHVAVLHGWYEEPGAFYTAVELCNGGELFERTAKQKNYAEEWPRNIIRALLSAVDHLHRHGIVIRNLKPEHLLLSDPSEHAKLKITDLKFATDDGKGQFPFHEQTRSAEYNAPETSKERCGPAADIWCVGTISYILVGGYYPFRADNEVELLKKIKTGKVEFEEKNWGCISPSVKDLIQRMLMVEPTERIDAAQALEHEWMTTGSDDLARKNLEHNHELFVAFNAKRKLKQAVSGIVFLIHASRLKDSKSQDSATAEHAFRVTERLLRTMCIEQGPAQETPEVPPTPATVAASSFSSTGFVGPRPDSLSSSAWNASSTSSGGPGEENQEHHPDCRSEPSHPPLITIPEVCSRGRVTLARTLGPGPEMFDQSLKHGVRLTVQDGCRPDPDPSGPVFLEKVAAMVNCDGKKWSMGTTVICAPDGAQFSPPLLLDFFVRYDASNWDSEEELEKILKDYQVLRKEEEDDRWWAAPRETLKLIRLSHNGVESAHIRMEVNHFTSFCCCFRLDPKNPVPAMDFSNARAVVVNNLCNMDLFVVSIPSTITESESNTVRYGVSAAVAGVGAGVNFEQGGHTTTRPLDVASLPSYETIRPGAYGNFDLQAPRQNIIMLLCTVEGLPLPPPPPLRPQRSGEPYTESKNDFPYPPSGQRTPGDHVEAQMIVLKYWGCKTAYGGRQINVTSEYFPTKVPDVREMTLSEGTERNRARLALEMADLQHLLAPEPMQASSPTSPGGRKSGLASRLWAMFGPRTER